MKALASLAQHVPVVSTIHPRTAQAIEEGGLSVGDVRLLPPVGYLDMLALERGAHCVVTDSGGVQKEAFFQGRPCVTLRTETEWVELVELGWNRLLPPSEPDLAHRLRLAIDAGSGRSAEPYGDGHAADRVSRLRRTLTVGSGRGIEQATGRPVRPALPTYAPAEPTGPGSSDRPTAGARRSRSSRSTSASLPIPRLRGRLRRTRSPAAVPALAMVGDAMSDSLEQLYRDGELPVGMGP